MKFMVINRPTGHNKDAVSGDPSHMRQHAADIRKWLHSKDIECCYHMVSGGHVYVVNVNDIHELQLAVRRNPLFEESDTEVIPITDAADFLEEYASFMERAPKTSTRVTQRAKA